MKLYVESSVWNFYFADHVRDKQQATREFFRVSAGAHELYVSVAVLEELGRTPAPARRDEMLELVERISPVFMGWSAQVGTVADRVIEMGGLTERSRVDALHVGYAVANGMDALVSWNMRDLVKLKTKRVVGAICRLLGYPELEIVTPEQV